MNYSTRRFQNVLGVKPPRRIRIVEKATQARLYHVISIRVGERVDRYRLCFIPSDLGEGFRLEKVTGDRKSYDVNLSASADCRDSFCDCLGFSKVGRCKHVEGLNALRRAGQL